MFTMDHFQGSFEFEVETGSDAEGVYARAHGYEARHPFSAEQALNDLNEQLDIAISTGKLVPTMGG
jgi:hypothetical protein